MSFLSRFITIFVLFAALQTGLAHPPDTKPEKYSTLRPKKTKPMATPTPSMVQSPTKPGYGGNSDIQTFLGAHNIIRSRHGASPLVWSNTLAGKAQQWAAKCKVVHSSNSGG